MLCSIKKVATYWRCKKNEKNISAKEAPEKERAWFQKENGYRQRPQGPGPQTRQGQSQTDPLRKMPTAPMPWALFLVLPHIPQGTENAKAAV